MGPSGTLLRIAVFAALASMLLALVPATDVHLLPDSNEPMETGARSGPDLIVDYLSASWSTADAGDSKRHPHQERWRFIVRLVQMGVIFVYRYDDYDQ